MSRLRKLTEERRSLINQLLATYKPEGAEGVQSMLKDLLGDTLQGMLEAELEEDLGYSKYDYKGKETDNRRNGYSKKTVTSSMGAILILISHVTVMANLSRRSSRSIKRISPALRIRFYPCMQKE